jgi:hypothetical protein
MQAGVKETREDDLYHGVPITSLWDSRVSSVNISTD